MFEAIAFDGNAIRLLDQRALPRQTNYLTLKTPKEAASAIFTMAVRGAPMIGITAAFGMAISLRGLREDESLEQAFQGAKQQIQASRPTAKNLFFALQAMEDAFEDALREGLGLNGVQERLNARALALFREETQRSEAISRFGAELIPNGARVLTHCNTGSLAVPGPGTALGAIKEAFAQGKVKEVYVDETRPLLQGSRLTAFELSSLGIPYRVIADGTAASLLEAGKVDAVLVGADRIAKNGDTANKVGTLMLARLCAVHTVPFFVLAPTSTIDPEIENGLEIPIEERNEAEVLTFAGTLVAPPGARAFNPAFDVTPAGLVRAFVTEQGVVQPPFSGSLSA
jgi:methylthioribose-1-phosphate isomerase